MRIFFKIEIFYDIFKLMNTSKIHEIFEILNLSISLYKIVTRYNYLREILFIKYFRKTLLFNATKLILIYLIKFT